jgi:D-alanyl-D-alanine dipeptidase
LIELGYISEKSQHSTGAAVDLTIVALSADRQPRYDPTDDYDVCTATKPRREPDNSEDAGTGFDCFDPASHTGYPALSSAQHAVRKLMVEVLSRHGFANYAGEWWHFRFTFAERPLRMHDFVVRRPGL